MVDASAIFVNRWRHLAATCDQLNTIGALVAGDCVTVFV